MRGSIVTYPYREAMLHWPYPPTPPTPSFIVVLFIPFFHPKHPTSTSTPYIKPRVHTGKRDFCLSESGLFVQHDDHQSCLLPTDDIIILWLTRVPLNTHLGTIQLNHAVVPFLLAFIFVLISAVIGMIHIPAISGSGSLPLSLALALPPASVVCFLDASPFDWAQVKSHYGFDWRFPYG